MSALLVQTWRSCGASGREPAVGWAPGAIVPEFDDLARPIKRKIHHAAVAALRISFRPGLLVGVSQTIANSDTLNAVREQTMLRGRSAFERLATKPRLKFEPRNFGLTSQISENYFWPRE